MVHIRSTLAFALFFSFLGACRLSGQCREDDFRKITNLSLGNFELTDIAYQSVSVDSVDVHDGVSVYTVFYSVRSSKFSIASGDSERDPSMAGRASGDFRVQMTVTGPSCSGINRIQAIPKALALQITGIKPIAVPAFGNEANWVARSLSITNQSALDISSQGATGLFDLTSTNVTIKGLSISLDPSGPPFLLDVCSATGTRATLTLDSSSRTPLKVVGAFTSCSPSGTVQGRVSIGSPNFEMEASGFRATKVLISASPKGYVLRGEHVTLSDPGVSLRSTKMPIEGFKTISPFDFTATLANSGKILVGQPTAGSDVSFEPDQSKIIEHINDGTHVREVLLPTSDPHVRLVSSYTLRETYTTLANAMRDGENHHSILLVVNPDGTVTSMAHTVIANGSLGKEEGGKRAGEYICIGLGYGAKAAITGVEAAAAVSRILPLALSTSLYAGVMLSPAVTPFVFAGVTAVGVAAQLAGSEIFWGAVSNASGIPVGLPGLTGKDILGDLAQKGVEDICEVAIQEMTSIPEPWPSLQRVLVLPANKGDEPIQLQLDQRRNFLVTSESTMKPMTKQETAKAKSVIDSSNVRQTQAAYSKDQQVWQEYIAQRDRLLAEKHASEIQQGQKQWIAQQQNNARSSGITDQRDKELKSGFTNSFGDDGGVSVIWTSGSGSGAGQGGAGSSCNSCGCSLTCIGTTWPKQ